MNLGGRAACLPRRREGIRKCVAVRPPSSMQERRPRSPCLRVSLSVHRLRSTQGITRSLDGRFLSCASTVVQQYTFVDTVYGSGSHACLGAACGWSPPP